MIQLKTRIRNVIEKYLWLIDTPFFSYHILQEVADSTQPFTTLRRLWNGLHPKLDYLAIVRSAQR